MRQVLSWTFGSFFRTIGKVIAFLVLGGVAAYFFATHDIKLPNLFRFALMQVNAATFNNEWISGAQWKIINGSYATATQSNDGYYSFATTNNGANRYYIKFAEQISFPSDGKEVRFNIKFNMLEKDEISIGTTENAYTCNIQSSTQHPNSSGSMADDVEFQYNYFTCLSHTSVSSGVITDYSFALTLQTWFNNNEWSRSPCYAVSSSGDTFSFTCPISQYNTNINGLMIQISTPYSSDVRVGVNDLFSVERDSSQSIIDAQHENTQAIEEQTQQQQEQHEEIMDTNMTETNETASSFFNNFQTDDIGGLSGIVTAPLVMINSMLSGSCVQPSATWKGATISLPCGDMLWSRNGADDLKNLLNIFYGGVICYYAIRKLFIMVEGMKDPTNDRIEVSDL